MGLIESPWILPACGIAIGVALGFFARRHHFCTMSALERHWFAADSRGIRAWGLAAVVALTATQILSTLGLIDISDSFYLTEPFSILGTILGGLMFGIGMALVGTCGFGAIVRLGGGNLRALVVLTGIGLAAVAAQRGITGHLRVAMLEWFSIDLNPFGGQSIGAIASHVTGLDISAFIAALFSVAGFWWVFKDRSFRQDHGKILAGLVIGLGITAGWVATSWFSDHLFVPVQIEAGSFVMPIGDAIMQIITVTGDIPDYGVGLAVGVFLGAGIAAWYADDMRWEACDDARELSRHLLGAFLMGTGGVFALGCTIGQGVSAASLMTVSAPVAMISIIVGARIGLGFLIENSLLGFLLPQKATRGN